MSVNHAVRFRVAVAAILVIAVVIVVVTRLAQPTHRTASPAPITQPGGATTTTATGPSNGAAGPGGPGAADANAPATALAPGAATAPSSAGARATGPYANGAPARLAVAPGAPLDPLPPPDAGWTPLSVVQGTGSGSYATFSITSATTQVRFRSSAGQFHVFVVDQAQGRAATAGYADVDCVGPCADMQTLSVPKGTYHVEVDADGSWELSLEEYR